MIKKILVLIILMQTSSVVVADREKDYEADHDKYGAKYGWCPQEQKYGHHAIIVDTTEGFSEAQYSLLQNQILNDSSMEEIPSYDKITIINVSGKDIQATETVPLFSKCRPRIKSAGFFDLPETTLKQMTGFFNKDLSDARKSFEGLEDSTGDFSQIMEQIKELSRIKEIDFSNEYEYRKLIIFSDLMQFSKNVNLISSCRDRKKCITWDNFKNDPSNRMKVRNMMPRFGENPPEVFVYYLQCKHDKNLNIGLLEFWDGYFTDAGIDWDYDTETSCN
tara:strand:- start:1591 stop:2421 length:831 start_codon:yes stop_codon:yes gene_type:complete